jgi:CubicO group peptidase (beta-lactamase class C family)
VLATGFPLASSSILETGAVGVDERIAADVRLPSALPCDDTEQPSELAALMERFRIPAVSVAVVAGGTIDWARAWGVRDARSGESVTPQTLFQAGSISKPVAAMSALCLVAEGKLGLDADVNELLVSWKVPANLDWQPHVSVRQLLSHTAGLTVHGFPGYPRDAEAPALDEVLDGKGNTPPVRVSTIPGLQFSYSGGGYCVLQQLLVDVTGKPFPELARELVLDPLGMTDSTYEEPLPEHLWPRAASGHRQGGKPVDGGWHVYPEMAAAGLWTTPTDLAKFLTAVQQAKAGSPGTILPRELADEVLRPHASNVAYGLGLRLEGEGPSLLFGHGGDDQGFIAWMGAYAEVGLGAVVMTNADDGWRLIGPLREAIARAYEWPDSLSSEPQVGQSTVDNNLYLGLYRLDDGQALRIERGAAGLVLVPPRQDPIELLPADGDEWFARAAKVRVVFDPGEDGRAERLVIHQEAEYVEDLVADRINDPSGARHSSPAVTRSATDWPNGS